MTAPFRLGQSSAPATDPAKGDIDLQSTDRQSDNPFLASAHRLDVAGENPFLVSAARLNGETTEAKLRANPTLSSDEAQRHINILHQNRVGLAQLGNEEDEENNPGLGSRIADALYDTGKSFVTHPLDTAAQFITAPIKSATTAVLAPGVGEHRNDPRLSKGGAPPQMTDAELAREMNTPIDAEHGGVTTTERTAGAAQTLANLAAPSLGAVVGGGLVGASYSPGDPLVGAAVGATVGKGLHETGDAVGSTRTGANERFKPAIDNAFADLARESKGQPPVSDDARADNNRVRTSNFADMLEQGAKQMPFRNQGASAPPDVPAAVRDVSDFDTMLRLGSKAKPGKVEPLDIQRVDDAVAADAAARAQPLKDAQDAEDARQEELTRQAALRALTGIRRRPGGAIPSADPFADLADREMSAPTRVGSENPFAQSAARLDAVAGQNTTTPTPTTEAAPDINNSLKQDDAAVATSPQVSPPSSDDWFGRSQVTDKSGNPLVVYHGTTADVSGPLQAGTEPHTAGIFFSDSRPIAGSVYGEEKGAPNVAGVSAALDKLSPEQQAALAARLQRGRRLWSHLEAPGDGMPSLGEQMTGLAAHDFDNMEHDNAIDDLARELKVPARVPAQGSNVVAAHLHLENPLVVDGSRESFDPDQQAAWIRQARDGGHDGLIIRHYDDGGIGSGSEYRSAGRHTVYVAFNPDQVRRVGAPTPSEAPTPEKLTPFDTPAVLEAREHSRNTPQTFLDNSPERIALRQRVGDEHFNNAIRALPEPPRNDRQAVIVLGNAGSGKSSVAALPASETFGAPIFDTDEAKKLLPEYDNGRGSATTFREAGAINQEARSAAVERGMNFVFPTIGSDPKSLGNYIDALDRQGYNVHLRLVDTPTDVAAGRAVSRYEAGDGSHFVDPDLILKGGDQARRTYEALKSRPGVASYAEIDNGTNGRPAQLVDAHNAPEWPNGTAGSVDAEPAPAGVAGRSGSGGSGAVDRAPEPASARAQDAPSEIAEPAARTPLRLGSSSERTAPASELPSYPDGFSMGDSEPRIPEVPKAGRRLSTIGKAPGQYLDHETVAAFDRAGEPTRPDTAPDQSPEITRLRKALDDATKQRTASDDASESEGPVQPRIRRAKKGDAMSDQPRYDDGSRRPLHLVTVNGLVKELVDLEDKRVDAARRSAYQLVEDENFHSSDDGKYISKATAKNGEVSMQAKAFQNMADYDRIDAEVMHELEHGRGLPRDVIDELVNRRREAETERAGMANDATDDDTSFDFSADEPRESASESPAAGEEHESPIADTQRAEELLRGFRSDFPDLPLGEPRKTTGALLNASTFDQSPAIQGQLAEAESHMRLGGVDKTRVPVAEGMARVKAMTHDALVQMGLDPLTMDAQKVKRLSGEEIVAIKGAATHAMDQIAAISKDLESPNLDEATRTALGNHLEKTIEARDSMLEKIVRASSQKGRDLSFLRQIANRSLDPDVWVQQARRLSGDRPLSDETITSIRKLARDTAEACGQ